MSLPAAADPRVGAAVLAALGAADKAIDVGNRAVLRQAVGFVFHVLDQCPPEVREVALDRLMQIAMRCPASQERDALLARSEAIIGVRGHA